MAYNINGIVIGDADRAFSGLRNVSTDFGTLANGGAAYIANIPWNVIRDIAPELEGTRYGAIDFRLGRFNDPRKAAYIAQYFIDNPPSTERIMNYVESGTEERRPPFYHTGEVNFPPELFDTIPWDGIEADQRRLEQSGAGRHYEQPVLRREVKRREAPAREGFYKKYPGKDGFAILKGIMNHYGISKDAMTRLLDVLTTNEFELRFGNAGNKHDLSHFADQQYQQPAATPAQNRGGLAESTQRMISNIEQELLVESTINRIKQLSGLKTTT